MKTKIIKILFFLGIIFNGVSLHAITVVPLDNFVGGTIEFLIAGVDLHGNHCLYNFELFIPACVEDTTQTRTAPGLTDRTSDYKLVLTPNPTKDITTIIYENLPLNSELYVYDLTGRLMITQYLSEKSGKININLVSFPSGIYIAVVKFQGALFSQFKLVKQ